MTHHLIFFIIPLISIFGHLLSVLACNLLIIARKSSSTISTKLLAFTLLLLKNKQMKTLSIQKLKVNSSYLLISGNDRSCNLKFGPLEAFFLFYDYKLLLVSNKITI